MLFCPSLELVSLCCVAVFGNSFAQLLVVEHSYLVFECTSLDALRILYHNLCSSCVKEEVGTL